MLSCESRRLYSWWWDSHISPKNSKWLQENLTDMDAKVKSMIKLIEEDADSFARRAEMYYKKRPELMKLVEEFYRAYRALAERYDYATGELRHAQRTLQAAFPDQSPFGPPEDSPSPAADMPENGSSGLQQLHQMLLEGKLQKDGKETENLEAKIVSESERANKAECEIEKLKKELADILAEKESLLVQFHQSLEKFSNADVELNRALEKSRILEEKASEAEKEVRMLKETLRFLQIEKDVGLTKQMEYLETISDLEEQITVSKEESKGIDERAIEAEIEVRNLTKKLSRLESENDAGLLQYGKCLDKISVLEKKIVVMEEDSKTFSEQAAIAELEVEKLRRDLSELTEEKEALRVLYSECLEKSYKLELDLSSAQDDVHHLTTEILKSTEKLRNVEEICVRLEISNQNLKMEASDLAEKIMSKDRELCEKHDELEKLRISAKDEHTHCVQIEAALQTLQTLYTRSQEEQRTLAVELKNGLRMLKDLEICKLGLEEENTGLNEINRNAENEIVGLKKMKERLEEEVALQIGQSAAMQKEISGLKDEITDLNSGYQALMGQLEFVGLDPESFGSSVKYLQDENRELEGSRNKVVELEISCESLHGEKTALFLEKTVLLSQLHVITINMQKLMDQNSVLETSLSTANVEIENLQEKSKNLETLCDLLNDEKSNLMTERSMLASQLDIVNRRLETLENRFTEFEERYVGLEKEKESGYFQIQELISSLKTEKRERETNQIRIDELENRIHRLLEDSKSKKEEFQEELDKAVIAQFENFILHKFIQDVEEKNESLLVEREKHIEASKLADKLISELETEILEQQVEEELLLVEVENLRLGIYQVFLSLEIGSKSNGRFKDENISVEEIIDNIKDLKRSLSKKDDEKQRLLVENDIILTLLRQLRLEFRQSELHKTSLINDFENELIVLREKLGVTQKDNVLMKRTIDELESKIKLTEEIKSESEVKIDALEKEKVNLGLELDMLHEELEDRKNIEENLTSEFELWDAEATSFIFDLQISSTRDILFESKVRELAGVCENLEGETVSKNREIEEMKRKESVMESEIEGLKAQLLAYNPVISSLKENITSLEKNVFTMANVMVSENRKSEDLEVKVHPDFYHLSDSKLTVSQKSLEPNGISDLIEFQTRIAALEKVIVEDINTGARRESSERIEIDIKPKFEDQKRNKPEKLRGKRYLTLDNLNLTKPKPEISEARKGVPIRDIPLDQASDGSSSTNSRSRSRKGYLRTDDMMIEQLQMAHKIYETEKKSKRLPYEPQIEDFGVDKLEVVPDQEGKKGKLLERLAADAQKLASLETTVKDLTKRLETGKKSKSKSTSKKANGVDFDTMKEQLEEAEETVLQLVNVNVESTASVEKNPSLSAWVEQEDAWKESERIKRVQVEVQKIQYVLLKLEDGKKSHGKSRFSRTKSRTSVILRDFIHRGGSGRRKRPLCGCFTPSATKGDRVKM